MAPGAAGELEAARERLCHGRSCSPRVPSEGWSASTPLPSCQTSLGSGSWLFPMLTARVLAWHRSAPGPLDADGPAARASRGKSQAECPCACQSHDTANLSPSSLVFPHTPAPRSRALDPNHGKLLKLQPCLVPALPSPTSSSLAVVENARWVESRSEPHHTAPVCSNRDCQLFSCQKCTSLPRNARDFSPRCTAALPSPGCSTGLRSLPHHRASARSQRSLQSPASPPRPPWPGGKQG